MSETMTVTGELLQRPLIGISGPARQRLSQRLIGLGLRLQGARTCYIGPGQPVAHLQLDGLVLSGGTHVHPQRFSQQPEVVARYDQNRDETDWHLLDRAEALQLPVLGICRGAQLINVHRGGSLCQNVTPLRNHTRHRPLLLPLQTVRLVSNSRTGELFRWPTVGTNRIHSQAIKKLGRNLRVVALDNDLFVQAIEGPGEQWLVGVQWHPEYLLYHPLHRRLFRELVHAARNRLQTRMDEPAGSSCQ